ncbi:Helitron helicase-like protein [Phytophthora palmivora]|uniref:Helitron helicase-like protein n=1 Tax=Phytophthora palmivora TaxID=4796 RepID=A0A2P4XAF1_9STRA|nr:Helitron helicase-like protein [Phytophthora palmivora]
MSDEQHTVIQEGEAVARASQRNRLSQEQRREIRERATNARATSRRLMTLDERLELREEELLSTKKVMVITKTVIPEYPRQRHFESMPLRFTVYLSLFGRMYRRGLKFRAEMKKCCCMGGPVKLRQLFNNPVYMQSIRAYNNTIAFTSIGASRSEPLQVDESVTRRGIYYFHVMGTVCHRMGSLLPAPDGKPMFAQIYINDPASAARVASRTE